MNKKEIAERMLISGCTRAQVEFVLQLEVVFLRLNDSNSKEVGLKIKGHCFCYTTFMIPKKVLNKGDL